MVGTTMMAIALSSGTAKLIRPIAIGGMPMPIAPLATPAMTNATAITAICSSDIYAASGREPAHRPGIGFADAGGNRAANDGARGGIGRVRPFAQDDNLFTKSSNDCQNRARIS